MNTLQRLMMGMSVFLPALAFAQEKVDNAPKPPEMEILQEGPPAVTTTPKQQNDQDKEGITEKVRPDGTHDITVKSGPSTYKMKPQTDRYGKTTYGAQWTVKEFGGADNDNNQQAQENAAPVKATPKK